MRLIDADAMLETLKRKYPQLYTGKPKDSWMHYAWLVYYWAVREAPTIDAVPVVRCKDCKRRKNARENGRLYWGGYEYYCGIARYGVTDDGFCYYGERKSDD